MFDVFPVQVTEMWREWELRVLILTSLFLQIFLILLSPRRKYTSKLWIRIAMWSAYLLAEWVATVALGIISQDAAGNSREWNRHRPKKCAGDELRPFWAPFLLLHLGGPDSITAYSLEDNELWMRHLLGLLVQSGVALYVFMLSWPGPQLLSVWSGFVLAAGLIKCGERTLALRMASSERLRSSMLTPPDPGPNYPKFMEEFTLRKREGHLVKVEEVIEAPLHPSSGQPTAGGDRESQLLLKAMEFFKIFRVLFVDLILSYREKDDSKNFFRCQTDEDAFYVVELELGFAYDVLYTKAPVVHNTRGYLLRFLSFLFIFTGMVGFSAAAKGGAVYCIADVIVTYSLPLVGILLEVYAIWQLLGSDWTEWRRHNRKSPPSWPLLLRSVDFIPIRQPKQRWSNSMAQYNLLDFCLDYNPPFCPPIEKLFGVDEILEQHRHKKFIDVSPELKSLIFTRLKEDSDEDLNRLCKFRGGVVLREDRASFMWSPGVEFDQSILTLHVATDLCFHHDGGTLPERRESQRLSNYMLYLLVMCPLTLPMGIGMIRFRDTCAEAKGFFWGIEGEKDRRRLLKDVNAEVNPVEVKGDRSKSVLFDACRMAAALNDIERGERWRLVCRAWVEMLGYAATHCRGNQHAQLLRKGGELLTHVWLLMAHLGITEQFQISKGHARAKLWLK